MKKFIMEQPYLDIFPESKIGILVCNGIDNHIKEEDKYAGFLKECEQLAQQHIQNPEFTSNPIIRTWRDAFYKFKTKKGARCSIEALLKRVAKGNSIGTINPLVDIYNGISLKYDGDNRLTVAEGGEEFVTYGSDKSEPPYPGEVVYKDNAGAICRCFNWRESVRTMLTEETTNAFMIIETVAGERDDVMDQALEEMKAMIEAELGGTCTKYVASAQNPEVVIAE